METQYDMLQPKQQQNQSIQQIVFDPFQQFDQQQQQQQQLQQHMMMQQQQQQQQLQLQQQMMMQQQMMQQQQIPQQQQQGNPLYPDLSPPPNYQQGFLPQTIPQGSPSNGSGESQYTPTLQLCPICQMAVPGEQLSIHLHYCSIQQQQQQFVYQQQLQQQQNQNQLIPTISPVQNVNQQQQMQPQYVIMAPGSAQVPQAQTNTTTTTVTTVKSGGPAPTGQSAPVMMKPATAKSPHSKLVLDKKLLLQTPCSAMNGDKMMMGNANVFKTHFNFVAPMGGRTIVVTIPYDTVNEIRTENDNGKKMIKFFTKDGKFHTFFNFKGKYFDKAYDLLTKNHHQAQKVY